MVIKEEGGEVVIFMTCGLSCCSTIGNSRHSLNETICRLQDSLSNS